jgi:hypothetical protein
LFGLLMTTTDRSAPPEHAVLVYLTYSSSDLDPLYALEDELANAINEAQAGEFDGNDVAADGSDAILYMYGPDADALFEAVRSTLERSPLLKGARVVLRYGPPADGVPEKSITLS